MSEKNIRQKVHQAVDQMTSSAKPDPWLAQKVRSRAQEREEEPMKKKVPAGIVIVLAIMLLMTAVAAAVTNGFGLLRVLPEQADNTAFTDRIVSIGQTWEGKYFSAEIKEAVFDGYKLRFSMSVTPKEGAEKIFAYPVVKAVCEGRKMETSIINVDGWADKSGFWVPDMKPLIPREDFDLNDMVYEVSLMDDNYDPTTVSEDVEWTITFNVLRTDWKVSFEDSGFPDEVKCQAFRKKEYEAFDRHELLLDEYGYGMEDIIEHPYVKDGAIIVEDDFDSYYLNLYTKDVFTLEEQATFSFVADKAEVRKVEAPVKFVLPEEKKPEEQKYEVTKAEATADGFCIMITRTFKYSYEAYEYNLDNLPWTFKLKSDEAELQSLYTTLHQGDNGFGRSAITYTLEYNTNKPISSVTLVPVQHTDSEDVEREDLAIELKLE
ncbi:MAG: hypothetical protein IJK71_08435 [Clostridia bacterium]|nr:hypothetical protein [Clostridia bacterium]